MASRRRIGRSRTRSGFAGGAREAHGHLAAARGSRRWRGPGRLARHPPPVHEAEAQADHLPGAPADPGTAQAISQEVADQELAAPGRPDAPARLDGLGPGPPDLAFGGFARRPRSTDGPGHRGRHQPVDAVHRARQGPSGRGEAPGRRDPQEDDRRQRGLRDRLGLPLQAPPSFPRGGDQADRVFDDPAGQPPAQ